LEKNVIKNSAIIVLVIFLSFSLVLNVFYIVRNQTVNDQNDNLVFSGRIHRNQTATDFQFKPFNGAAVNATVSGYPIGAPLMEMAPKVPLF
jgi:hypothetical protein